MNANDVLIDILEDNRRRLLRLCEHTDDDCLAWAPGPGANTITVTIWHMGRIFDVYLTRQARGQGPLMECWFRNGWSRQTGYDPRGRGLNGWGMLTGYTPDELKAIPPFTCLQSIGYLNDVYDAIKEYLTGTPLTTLLQPAPGFDGKYNRYQCIQMALLDNVRHLGEIFAIRTAWERQSQKGKVAGRDWR
jgi:hypothetical protein